MYQTVDRSFTEAFETLDRSDDALAQAASAAWELSAGRFFLVCSLLKLGDFPRLRSYADRFVREAEQRGNAYTRTSITRVRNILWLVDDDPAGARKELESDSWTSYTREYHLQHWLELRARIEIAIYEGAPLDPELLAGHEKGIERSFLLRMLEYRCETEWMMGRMALAEASRDPARRRVARRSAARLASYGTHHTRMLAGMLLATLAVQERKLEAAASGFREVAAMADAAHIVFVAAAARRRLGALVGGDEGRELVAAAERWMREAGIRNPERMTHLASPCELEPGGRL
jgi:eukaryotic-like serine/threonine-protein kinase